MRYTRFEIDGHEFDTYKEAREFRKAHLDIYDTDFRINTLLYDSIEAREQNIVSIDARDCGTDWRVSEWMRERMLTPYTQLEDYPRLWQGVM